MGHLIKSEAVYPTPFWRAEGLSGQAVNDEGIASVPFDNSPPDGSVGVLFGFTGGSAASRLTRLTPAQRRKQVLSRFRQYVGDQALSPARFIEHDWRAERWTGGCPTGIRRPGVLSRYGATLRAPIGRVHFAGTETADYWQGYMDGAVRAGERAAREVLSAWITDEYQPVPAGAGKRITSGCAIRALRCPGLSRSRNENRTDHPFRRGRRS